MVEINKSTDDIENKQDFSVGNIFEDFEDDKNLNDEIEKTEELIQRDSNYYIGLFLNILKYINIFAIIGILFFTIYIKIQENVGEKEILNSICYLFLPKNINYYDIPNSSNCMGIYSAKNILDENIEKEKKDIFGKFVNTAIDYYSMKNFINSEEVIFLLKASENKKNPLSLLVEFDKVKNEFLAKDKLKIQCHNLRIFYNELFANCDAYSSLWDKTIPGYEGDKDQLGLREGTSISIASSFLNFLEKQDDFILLDKQKTFKVEDVVEGNGYSFKTSFKLHILKRDLKLK